MNYFGEILKCILFLSDEYHRTIADSSNMTLLINKQNSLCLKPHALTPRKSQMESNERLSVVVKVWTTQWVYCNKQELLTFS